VAIALLAVSSIACASTTLAQEPWSVRGNAGTNPQTDFVGTTDESALSLRTNGREAMRVSADGKIGIGDIAPAERLTVRGNILLPSSTSRLMGGNGGLGFPSDLGDGGGGARLSNIGSVDIIIDSDNNNHNDRSFRVMGNGTDRDSAQSFFVIDELGRVGIGTTPSGNALTVQGGTFLRGDTRIGGKLGIGAPPGDSTLLIREPSSSADAGLTLSAGGSWPLVLRQTSASQFTIENGGKKRLGVSPSAIEVYTDSGGRSLQIRGEFSTGDESAWMSINDRGRERVTVAARNGETGRGGLVHIKNSDGKPTIHLVGDTGTGFGRIVTSVLEITGGADLAEPFEIAGEEVRPGSLVVIDSDRPGALRIADEAYDRRVAGVISGAGGLATGITLGADRPADAEGHREGHHVAMTGRVYALADASQGPIEPGDLLTTSDTPGHAMRAHDVGRSQGAVIGKAMSGLAEGRGLVLVLVNLQ
jgi:hypothetical protein